jgi:hypothetical protein
MMINGVDCDDEVFERIVQESCTVVLVEGEMKAVLNLDTFRRLLAESCPGTEHR